ncbi:MFS transporter [Streptomyces sp. MUM 203J]|uniref:MFS transporter n=1 Tax=Streptomyces sp. MUM 203J TaxID=2791990 RepID=UPI001F044AC6|nr:MFS transporter [Streptomyces sp. MUM 203J]MCH0542327.1 MFS transporter [Streptomyces sp. MUM 203J]
MTLPTSTPARGRTMSDARWSPALWGLLFVLAGNMLIDALEVSVAVVALPAIGADLGIPARQVHWVVTAFAVGFGALMLFGTRVVAVLGRRPVYLAALLVFAAASLASAFADGVLPLVATRLLKGFCAALTAPTGLAIIAATFPEGRARGRAVSVYTLFGASGFSAGLLLSGLLTEADWRWTFAFPAPIALLLFLCGLRLIPRDAPNPERPRHYDAAGALTLTGGVVLLVLAIGSVPASGWVHPRTLLALLGAAVLLTAFVRHELTTRTPLVRLDLLVNRPLVRSALGAAALNGSYLGMLLVVTVHLQRTAGWSALQTGLAILPASVPLAVSALHSGRLVNRFGAARLIALGAVFPPLGQAALLAGLDAPVRYTTGVLPSMLLVGAGFVLCFTALHLQATSAVPAGRQAEASGIYQTAVQLGAVLVLALVAALQPMGHRAALLLVTAVGALGLIIALGGVLPRRERPLNPTLENER